MKKLLAMALALVMALGVTTTAWAEGGDGSAAKPYSLEEFGQMTRQQYIDTQNRLGGTMYVNVGTYSYETNGTLGNGVRDDTTGQTPDHSKLNAYAENGYLGEKNDGANGKTVVFVGTSITSGVKGYASIDNIGTSLLLAVPAYTTVKFENITFNNVFSFDYQLYTSPWSQLAEIEFYNCTFNGIIVGAIATQSLVFDKCTFNDYTNTTSANSSNPTWIRPAYGNWTKEDNEGQGTDFRSLTNIEFKNNTVTSTRPVKFERIAQWEMETTVTATGNSFDISAQTGDDSVKNVGLYLGANAKFDLVADNNSKSANTSALVTAVYGTSAGLPEGSTVTDSNGNHIEIPGQVWKSNDSLTLETQYDAMVNGQLYADLSAAITAAGEGGTVKLMRSKTFTDDVTVSNNVTIDLNGKEVAFEGEKSMKIDSGKTMTLKDTAGDGSLSGVTGTVIAADGSELNQNNDGTYTVRPAEQQPTPPRYYYNSTTTTTKDDTKTSSPKTFDAGVGIYAVSAILSVTGMAYVGKKKF